MTELRGIMTAHMRPVMIRGGTELVRKVPGFVGGFGSKEAGKGEGLALIWTRRHDLLMKVKASEGDKEVCGELPEMGGTEGGALLFTGVAAIALDLGALIRLFLDPVIEGLSLTGELETVEHLPLMGRCVTRLALGRFAHHAEEEMDDGAAVFGDEAIPRLEGFQTHPLGGRELGGDRRGRPFDLLSQRFVEMIQEVHQVLMTVVGHGNAERLIGCTRDGFSDFGEKADGADIGGSVGGPERAEDVMVGEENATVRVFRGEVLGAIGHRARQTEDRPLGTRAEELKGGVGVTRVPHVLDPNHALPFGWAGGR
jgi:hypothetical protein